MAIVVQDRNRHRPETLRESNQRIELIALKRDITQGCDAALRDLDRLIPAVYELGPSAFWLLASASRRVEQMRLRVGDE